MVCSGCNIENRDTKFISGSPRRWGSVKRSLLLLVVVLVLPTLLVSQITHTTHFSSTDVRFSKWRTFEGNTPNEYDQLTVAGYRSSDKVGAPDLPVRYVRLIIPSNMDVGSVSVVKQGERLFDGKYRIVPIQPPTRMSQSHQDRKFQPGNQDIDQLDAPYPQQQVRVVNVGYFDGGNRIVTLELCPFQYKPLSGQLIFSEGLTYSLNLKFTLDKPLVVQHRSQKSQDVYDMILKKLVDNPEAVPLYQKRPLKILTSMEPLPSAKQSSKSSASIMSVPQKPPFAYYIIITDSTLVSSFNNFANYNENIRSCPTVIVTTEQIVAWYSQFIGPDDLVTTAIANDTAVCIRRYLKEAYSQGATFVLLGGDHTIVPPYYTQLNNRVPIVPTDWYYSVFHEIVADSSYNSYPDLFVGRLPFGFCSSSAYFGGVEKEINNWTQKVIDYETQLIAGNQFIKKILWSEADGIESIDRMQSDSVQAASEGVTMKLMAETDPIGPPDPNLSGSQTIAELKKGYGLYLVSCHGSICNYATSTKGENKSGNAFKYGVFSTKNSPQSYYYINDPGNTFESLAGSSTVLFSESCMTACYTTANDSGWICIAEAFLGDSAKGGPAYLGNTDDAAAGEVRIFLENYFVFNPGYIGVIEALSRTAMNRDGYEKYVHNLFGDPMMMVGTVRPGPFQAAKKPTLATSPIPGDSASNVELFQLLKWTGGVEAVSYDVYFGNTNPPAFQKNQKGTIYYPGILNPGTTYYWCVVEKNSNMIRYSPLWSFTTKTVQPILTLNSPVNGKFDATSTILLQWETVPDAVSYTVIVSTNINMMDPHYQVFNQQNIKTNSINVSMLQPHTNYFWIVEAISSSGSTIALSNIRNFVTGVSVSPTNGSTGVPTAPTLQWTNIYGYASYWLQVSLDSNFSSVFAGGHINSNSFKIYNVPLFNHTKYYWRIYGVFSDGSPGVVCGPWSFTTAFAAPTLLSPADGAIDQPLIDTLNWKATPGATSYIVSGNWGKATVTGTSYCVPGVHSSKYNWSVTALYPDGSATSPAWSFSTRAFNSRDGDINETGSVPLPYHLSQNYPNPFNPSTIIQFNLLDNSKVVLKIYDVLGREIRALVDDDMQAGSYTVQWDGADEKGRVVGSGIYFYRLTCGSFICTKKMMMMR